MENDRPPRRHLQDAVWAAARNLGWLLASRGVLAVLSLAYLAIATRTLGPHDFGRFVLIIGASQAIAVFVGFQTWQIVVRYGVDHLLAGDEARLSRLLRACAALDAGSAITGIGLSAGVLLLWGDSFGMHAGLMRDTMLFAFVQLITIRSTALGVLRLRDRFSLSAVADSMTPVVRFVGAGAASLFMPNLHGFLFAWAAAELVSSGTYWLMLVRTGDIRLFGSHARPKGKLLEENPGLIRFALSTNAASSLGLGSKQVSTLLVGLYAGPAAAGVFRIAFQVSQGLSKLSQLLARAAFPEIVRAVRSAGAAELGRMLRRLFWASAAAAFVIIALAIPLGRPILSLVAGHDYARAYPLLLWLVAAGCLDLMTVTFEPVLMAAHRAGTALAARAVSTALLLLTTVLLLPTSGPIGASIGILVGSASAALLLGLAVLHYARSAARPAPAKVAEALTETQLEGPENQM
ncbi:MAG: polysaccharide biosynthesis family protein [Alphaproteobacteria bacterium]|nr:polysaccharide biosynthesis family protein [Alphaproteobacteria bacterium]